MRESTSAERVIAVLKRAGQELDDDQLGSATGITRQYVNTICRRLAADGVTSRQMGSSGKLVNRFAGTPQTPGLAGVPTAAPRRGRGRSHERRDARIAELIADFPRHVAAFEASQAFPGPSLYFHNRAVERRRRHDTAHDAMSDELLLEYIYAVLPAWGMHRLGKQAAKVGDFTQIVTALRSQQAVLEELWPLRITELSQADARQVAELAWQVIAAARVSTSRTQIVAGSKWLHHLLPDLIPPIDRQYTFSFFTGGRTVVHGGRQAFLDLLPLFAQIGAARKLEIQATITSGGFMATSEAKVIDNAIMGYMRNR